MPNWHAYNTAHSGHPPATNPQAAEGQVWIAFDEAPEVKLHYTRLQREAQVQGKLFILLAQQLEQAKIEEARDETDLPDSRPGPTARSQE